MTITLTLTLILFLTLFTLLSLLTSTDRPLQYAYSLRPIIHTLTVKCPSEAFIDTTVVHASNDNASKNVVLTAPMEWA